MPRQQQQVSLVALFARFLINFLTKIIHIYEERGVEATASSFLNVATGLVC